jgi:hypothetical protein
MNILDSGNTFYHVAKNMQANFVLQSVCSLFKDAF